MSGVQPLDQAAKVDEEFASSTDMDDFTAQAAFAKEVIGKAGDALADFRDRKHFRNYVIDRCCHAAHRPFLRSAG